MEYIIVNGDLCHYGLKGMKWGQRRWQYEDGRFNDAGKQRYFGQNSSHRPDSVRVLQGDPPARKSGSGSKASSETKPKKDFDKEKAKKIAKDVAIGAAIVGGTVLVAYGGYKIHEAGGFSNVSKNLKAKMRETKLEDLKLKQEFKAEKARIVGEGKQNLAKIGGETRNNIAQIRADAKNKSVMIRDEAKANLQKSLDDASSERLLKSIDPGNEVDRGVIKRELAKGADPKALKNKVSLLDTQERKLLNDGIVSLKDLEGRRGMSANEWENRNNNAYDNWLDQLSKGHTSSPKPVSVSSAKSAFVKSPKSSTTANINITIRKLSNTTKVRDVANNASTKTKNVVNTAKKVKLPKINADHIKAGTEFLSELNKTVNTAKEVKQQQQQRDTAIVKMYKAQHPNTKLSDKKILNNYRDMAG